MHLKWTGDRVEVCFITVKWNSKIFNDDTIKKRIGNWYGNEQ